jgi:tetratricopeptide (TPR) repeat protein
MDRIEKLLAMLEQQPNDAFLQHALALEHTKLGQDQAAQAYFEAILRSNADYVGSYYHLGKLLERQLNSAGAAAVYEEGMRRAKAADDRHSYNELRGALDQLLDD